MKLYKYLAKSNKGLVTQGELEAENADAAAEYLTKKALTPISIKEIPKKGIFAKISEFSIISSGEKVMFSKQLATLVGAGIPLSQAMHIMEDQTQNPRMRRAVAEISKDIEGGLSLSSAMEKQNSVFSPLYTSMIKAGEVGGILDETLEKMATEIEKEHELVAKIRGAMAYPSVIIVAMVGVVIYMITNIIPEIAKVFGEMGGKLPGSTLFLMSLSEALRSFGIFIAIGIAVAVYFLRQTIKNNQQFRYYWHMGILTVPILGKVVKKINVARFTRTLGSLLSSGVTMLEALQTTTETIQNEVFKKIIYEASEKVKNGSSLAEPLKNNKIFPFMVPQMIAVGEETGTMDVILGKLTDFYEKEIDNTVKNLSSLIEPIMMIFIGFSVGFIVISIISPIYQMSNLF